MLWEIWARISYPTHTVKRPRAFLVRSAPAFLEAPMLLVMWEISLASLPKKSRKTWAMANTSQIRLVKVLSPVAKLLTQSEIRCKKSYLQNTLTRQRSTLTWPRWEWMLVLPSQRALEASLARSARTCSMKWITLRSMTSSRSH